VLPPASNYDIIEKTFPNGKNALLYEEKTPYQLIRLFQNNKAAGQRRLDNGGQDQARKRVAADLFPLNKEKAG